MKGYYRKFKFRNIKKLNKSQKKKYFPQVKRP